MGIGLCKYLNRFSVMPYFHSAINVFKLLLLSSGFDICSLLAKNRGENTVDMYFFFSVTSDEGNEMRYRSRTS